MLYYNKFNNCQNNKLLIYIIHNKFILIILIILYKIFIIYLLISSISQHNYQYKLNIFYKISIITIKYIFLIK